MHLPAKRRAPTSVGSLLQRWRKARHLSQLELAMQAEISARHLCFVETGRARPSREMVLLLADALDVPLRDRNALLLAAGFAPVFEESSLDGPTIATVRVALDAILRQQEPFPAVVMNPRWDIVRTNTAAERFFGYMLAGATVREPLNVIRMMFDPTALRPRVRNWSEVAVALLRRVRREVVGGVVDDETAALLEEMVASSGVRRETERETPSVPVIPITFARDADEPFEFFSTVTTLGTPQDITLQELRIECFFPLDDDTARRVRGLVDG